MRQLKSSKKNNLKSKKKQGYCEVINFLYAWIACKEELLLWIIKKYKYINFSFWLIKKAFVSGGFKVIQQKVVSQFKNPLIL